MEPYASGLKLEDDPSIGPAGKGSFCKAASMLEVVGVCAMVLGAGRISNVLKVSCPAIGERVKNCCCIIGSTDAATELVERATLRSTLTAIQSLQMVLATKIGSSFGALTREIVSKFEMLQTQGRCG